MSTFLHTEVGPLDQKLRDRGALNIGQRLPAVIAFDLVGVVTKNGPNTETFPIGSHVFSQAIVAGGLQTYTLVDARFAALVPKGCSDTDVALFPINGITSALSLFSSMGFGIPFPGTPESKNFDYKSKTLLIIGGGTSCGKLATQMAKITGIGTIIATASLTSEEELKSYGATHVIDRRAPDVEAQIRVLIGDDLLYLYDTFTVGDLSFDVSLLSNTKKGTLVHLLPGKVEDEIVTPQKKAGYEKKQMHGSSQADTNVGGLFWRQFPKWLESGEIKILKYQVVEGLDAEKINAVLDGYRDGKGYRWHVRM